MCVIDYLCDVYTGNMLPYPPRQWIRMDGWMDSGYKSWNSKLTVACNFRSVPCAVVSGCPSHFRMLKVFRLAVLVQPNAGEERTCTQYLHFSAGAHLVWLSFSSMAEQTMWIKGDCVSRSLEIQNDQKFKIRNTEPWETRNQNFRKILIHNGQNEKFRMGKIQYWNYVEFI